MNKKRGAAREQLRQLLDAAKEERRKRQEAEKQTARTRRAPVVQMRVSEARRLLKELGMEAYLPLIQPGARAIRIPGEDGEPVDVLIVQEEQISTEWRIF